MGGLAQLLLFYYGWSWPYIFEENKKMRDCTRSFRFPPPHLSISILYIPQYYLLYYTTYFTYIYYNPEMSEKTINQWQKYSIYIYERFIHTFQKKIDIQNYYFHISANKQTNKHICPSNSNFHLDKQLSPSTLPICFPL